MEFDVAMDRWQRAPPRPGDMDDHLLLELGNMTQRLLFFYDSGTDTLQLVSDHFIFVFLLLLVS